VHYRLDGRTGARGLRTLRFGLYLCVCLGPFALVAAMGLLVSGCSPGADYPSIFPAVHDMPPPRADTPLDPLQVQQATEDLITQRNHLNGEAQGAAPGAATKDSAVAVTPPPAKAKATTGAGASSGPGAPGAATLTPVSETK
jgi:hypothetical protein